jgi:AcrR family transcriptional regulator
VPTPEKTSLSKIVAAGRELLEEVGRQGLTMQSVAERVGVRAPSLYKRVGNRADLLRAVAEATINDLVAQGEATDGSLEELVRSYRRFAHARPEGFRLMFAPEAPRDALVRLITPVLEASGRLAGEEHALEAARTVTAWATGFIDMELNGLFRMGGDVERAFEYGLAAILRALKDGH